MPSATHPTIDTASGIPDSQPRALLVVSLENLQVRYASPLAIAWLGLSADRLLGRSLMLSLPPLGQVLTVALAGGLGPVPIPLSVGAAKPDGTRLAAYAHEVDADAIIEFVAADEDQQNVEQPRASAPTTPADTSVQDTRGLQRRLDEMRQDLAALRKRVPCDESMLRGDDPILFWLWQAEAALAQISQRYASLAAPPAAAKTRTAAAGRSVMG